MLRPKAWSYSAWQLYNECPYKYKCKNILKIPIPEAEEPPAFIRGRKVHKDAEDFALGIIKKIPSSIKLLKKSYAALKREATELLIEKQWAYNKRWQRVEKYFGSDVWFRAKIDIAAYFKPHKVALIADIKTGKIKTENLEQAELYVPTAFEVFPDAEVVFAELWFSDHGIIVSEGKLKPKEYTIEDCTTIKEKWNDRIADMFRDKRYLPTPGVYCKWCNYSKAKGGPCEY